LCRERKIGCIARGLRDAEFQSLVIVITVILENNFELPGEPLSASRVIALAFFSLGFRFFFKHCHRYVRIVTRRLFQKFRREVVLVFLNEKEITEKITENLKQLIKLHN